MKESRRRRRLLIHPRWKQWGSRSRVPSPGGGVRGGGARFDTVEPRHRFETRGTERISFRSDGAEGRRLVAGCWGSDSGGGGFCVCVSVNLGQQCLCLTCKQEQKGIPACTHSACSEETQARGLTHISRTNCYRRSLVVVHKDREEVQC